MLINKLININAKFKLKFIFKYLLVLRSKQIKLYDFIYLIFAI